MTTTRRQVMKLIGGAAVMAVVPEVESASAVEAVPIATEPLDWRNMCQLLAALGNEGSGFCITSDVVTRDPYFGHPEPLLIDIATEMASLPTPYPYRAWFDQSAYTITIGRPDRTGEYYNDEGIFGPVVMEHRP